jgi:hypothetical protein
MIFTFYFVMLTRVSALHLQKKKTNKQTKTKKKKPKKNPITLGEFGNF